MAEGMGWLYAVGAVVVLTVLSAVLPILMRFFWAFMLALTVGLALHARQHPGEAMAAFGGMGAFLMARRPLLRLLGL